MIIHSHRGVGVGVGVGVGESKQPSYFFDPLPTPPPPPRKLSIFIKMVRFKPPRKKARKIVGSLPSPPSNEFPFSDSHVTSFYGK